MRGQPRAEPPGYVLHERRVVHDQPVTQGLFARTAVFEPEAPAVGFAGHEERIRARSAFSSVQPAQKTPSTPRAPPPRPRLSTVHAMLQRARCRRKRSSARRRAPALRSGPPCDDAAAARVRRAVETVDLESQPRGVAQLVEHRSPKPGVAGSSPVAPARQMLSLEPAGSSPATRIGVRRASTRQNRGC